MAISLGVYPIFRHTHIHTVYHRYRAIIAKRLRPPADWGSEFLPPVGKPHWWDGFTRFIAVPVSTSHLCHGQNMAPLLQKKNSWNTPDYCPIFCSLQHIWLHNSFYPANFRWIPLSWWSNPINSIEIWHLPIVFSLIPIQLMVKSPLNPL